MMKPTSAQRTVTEAARRTFREQYVELRCYYPPP